MKAVVRVLSELSRSPGAERWARALVWPLQARWPLQDAGVDRAGAAETPALTEPVLLSCQFHMRMRMLSYDGVDQDVLLLEAGAVLCKQLSFTKEHAN